MSPTRTSPVSFLKLSTDVASFYGFRPMREVERVVAQAAKTRGRPRTRTTHTFEAAALVCIQCAALTPGEPVLAFYATPAPTPMPVGLLARETGEFGLQAVGTSETVGEILLLRTVITIFAEWGMPVSRVRVNALGDRDSQMRFMRELSLFVRKHAERLQPEHRNEILADPSLLLRIASEAHEELRTEAPRPLTFLSEKSRSYFRSVLEHLEELGTPYELDDTLVGDERLPHVVFAFDLPQGDTTVIAALGGRYDDYLREHARRRDSVGVGASIFFRKKGAAVKNFTTVPTPPKPRIYFAQLGLRAKLQGLKVISALRDARVPVVQSFDAAHLSMQLKAAQECGVSHLLIMGQREALDGTIIVRSMQNSAQSTISLGEIPRFLKSLR